MFIRFGSWNGGKKRFVFAVVRLPSRFFNVATELPLEEIFSGI